MILVDSSVWIDYFRGIRSRETELLDQFLESEEIWMGDLILVEVLQGFSRNNEYHAAARMLSTLPIVDLGGRDMAMKAAQNHRKLRLAGITVRKTIDTVIATRCIENGYRLLHSDRDFDGFAKHLGLKVI